MVPPTAPLGRPKKCAVKRTCALWWICFPSSPEKGHTCRAVCNLDVIVEQNEMDNYQSTKDFNKLFLR